MNDEQTPALREAVENMATMRQAYDSLSQAAEAYNTGKTELAANITAKGVQASATETLPELAEKVSTIAQENYTIDGGEMYAKQLFGSLETPNYWNLYEVLANLLSDGRLVSYGGILLAEYYRGYDSLALAGAGSGGAYVVSDKDENGNFIMYTNDTTHVWATELDGKGNRWVAYCFADEYHDFQITDTNTSPHSIFIGRKVGTITSLVNGRVSEIVVSDGNDLKCFDTGLFTQNFGESFVVKGLTKQQGRLLYKNSNVERIYIEGDNIAGELTKQCYNFRSIIIKANAFSGSILGDERLIYYDFNSIIIDSETINGQLCPGNIPFYTKNWNECIIITEQCKFGSKRYDEPFVPKSLKRVNLFYKTNDRTKSVELWETFLYTEDLVLQDGWNKPLIVSSLKSLTEENMYSHILQRLKQDEPNCGAGVTITLGSTNLEKLTSQESQDLLAELRGTYGYTFA